jgi:hypothetical protein
MIPDAVFRFDGTGAPVAGRDSGNAHAPPDLDGDASRRNAHGMMLWDFVFDQASAELPTLAKV